MKKPPRHPASKCSVCGKRTVERVRRAYEYEISHDGRPPVTIRIPDLEVLACTNPACSATDPSETVLLDDDALQRITTETYRQLGLLTPDQIRAGREKLGLTQQELQALLGLGGNSLSRWEKGRVYQSRAMDTLLRLVFTVPRVVEHLQRISGDARELRNAKGAPAGGRRSPIRKAAEAEPSRQRRKSGV